MVNELINKLKEEEKRRVESMDFHPYAKNRTYHLCMSERYLSAFTELWMQRYKPCPFTMRDATQNVKDCIVVSITDRDGKMLPFITEAIAATKARLALSPVNKR